MKQRNPFVTIVGLILVSFQAAAVPMPRNSVLPRLKAAPINLVQATIEKSLGHALSKDQEQSLQASTEILLNSPRPVMFGRSETVLACVGATLAYIGKLQVGVCSDMNGNPFYIQMVGLGAVFGAAGQVFVFAAMHDNDQPIAPRFKVGGIGGTSARVAELFGFLKNLSQVAPLVGPDLGLFHSIWGNQAGVLAGANFGKIVGFDVSTMIIHDSFSQLFDSVFSGTTDLTFEEYQQRMEERKVRLGIQ